MAYYIRKGLVEENKDLFEKILHVVVQGGGVLRFDCRNPYDVPRRRNQLNRLLRAARDLPNECGGRYSKLRFMVTVSDDLDLPAVLMKPRMEMPAFAVQATVHKLNEHDVLEMLSKSSEDTVILDWAPSSAYRGDAWLQEQASHVGYTVDIMEFTEDDGPLAGTKSYVARKIVRSAGGFGILDREGYKKVDAPRS